MENILEVRNLNVGFLLGKKKIQVLKNVSFSIREGEVLAVIGETGCGKSVTGNAVLHLLPDNAVTEGEVYYKGKEILHLSEAEYRNLRGKDISAIPQSPSTSLNPMMNVGKQVAECVMAKGKKDKKETRNIVKKIFSRLHLPRENDFYEEYPWELSGGMCQRVLIGMGMITHARLLVIDEPTKAIDWSLRKNVSDILKELKEGMGCSMMMITHDIPVASYLADRVAVMYCGEIVEIGKTQDVLHNPAHPYTRGLIQSMPSNGFHMMNGFMPPFSELPKGCLFQPRCPYGKQKEECMRRQDMSEVGDGHYIRCAVCQEAYEEETYAAES